MDVPSSLCYCCTLASKEKITTPPEAYVQQQLLPQQHALPQQKEIKRVEDDAVYASTSSGSFPRAPTEQRRSCLSISQHYKPPTEGNVNPSNSRNEDSPIKRRLDKYPTRDSQCFFSEIKQTVIVFDWDDTLFPTSYLFDDLQLTTVSPIDEQYILQQDQRIGLANAMVDLQEKVSQLLHLACSKATVIIVTLAKEPWVENTCSMFFDKVGTVIEELDIKTVYAQEGTKVGYDKAAMMKTADHYAQMKGRAIAREVDAVYSEYEGQSWKNIISIGDSEFERVGTISSCEEYMQKKGVLSKGQLARGVSRVNVDGHVYKVRVKTFKMMHSPTISELSTQLSLLQGWLERMVDFDGHFDVDLDKLDDAQAIAKVEATLNVDSR